MNIAIIPARSKSFRIKYKNIKLFNNKPIIYYSIKAAIKTKLFNKIFVSTDDYNIAKIAIKYGAEVPLLREKNISDNYTSVAKVISKELKKIIKLENNLSFVCCIYATAPMIKYQDIIKGYQILKKHKCNYVFSATKNANSFYRSFKLSSQKNIQMIFEKNYNKRSQDLSYTYHDAGQFCWGDIKSWINEKKVMSNNSKIIEIPRYRSIDIDNMDDWKEAEYKFKNLNK